MKVSVSLFWCLKYLFRIFKSGKNVSTQFPNFAVFGKDLLITKCPGGKQVVEGFLEGLSCGMGCPVHGVALILSGRENCSNGWILFSNGGGYCSCFEQKSTLLLKILRVPACLVTSRPKNEIHNDFVGKYQHHKSKSVRHHSKTPSLRT